MIIDHIGIAVSDAARSKEFYSRALAPLGIEVLMEVQGHVGLGRGTKPEFWLAAREEDIRPIHVAFVADDRAQVDAFHAAALEAGGADNGPPGVREIYHPDYYGAFVLDPDGHNVEAVCHSPL